MLNDERGFHIKWEFHHNDISKLKTRSVKRKRYSSGTFIEDGHCVKS
jgi:hypothetical protein